jgi:hypothetical protein
MARQPLRRSIRGGRPYFFADPAVDKVLNMVVTLAGEVWALRERVVAMETIGTARGAFKAGEIDAFEFPPDIEQRLAGERKGFIEALFRVIGDAAPQSAPPASKRAAKKKVVKKGRR